MALAHQGYLRCRSHDLFNLFEEGLGPFHLGYRQCHFHGLLTLLIVKFEGGLGPNHLGYRPYH